MAFSFNVMERSSGTGADFITDRINSILTPVGFEVYPFKVDKRIKSICTTGLPVLTLIGWYNEAVDDRFKFDLEYDTLAYIVISTPCMFDKGFLPFLQTEHCERVRDPIDECVAHYFAEVKKAFPEKDITSLHDFEMHHSRRPKILVQTAGHVAGATRYYQRKDVVSDPWGEKKKIFGVCVHPKYGGWFGLRGVFIFKCETAPELTQHEPPDVVSEQADRIELLNRFNGNWQDWTFRDIIPVETKYSELQKQYFATAPRDRKSLIDSLNLKTARCLPPPSLIETVESCKRDRI